MYRSVSRARIADRLQVPQAWLKAAKQQFPVVWPAYYFHLIKDQDDPIAKMGKPDPEEWRSHANDLTDPVGDHAKRVLDFIVRKHMDRIIVLVTKRCHFYCRFCFRRDEPPTGPMTPDQWDQLVRYVQANPEIKEVILSGGDPLTLSDSELNRIASRLRDETAIARWRIHTRAPVHYPQRVTKQLVLALDVGLPLRVVTHFNHDQELTHESRRISTLFQEEGTPLLNQAVLLKGVNDTVVDQAQLWFQLSKLGVEGHYLHHPDRVAGNDRFRVTIERGMQIYDGLRAECSQAPPYVIDLPDGKGKVPVMDLDDLGEGWYGYQHPGGDVSRFRDIV